jgi:hypothetical protein
LKAMVNHCTLLNGFFTVCETERSINLNIF